MKMAEEKAYSPPVVYETDFYAWLERPSAKNTWFGFYAPDPTVKPAFQYILFNSLSMPPDSMTNKLTFVTLFDGKATRGKTIDIEPGKKYHAKIIWINGSAEGYINGVYMGKLPAPTRPLYVRHGVQPEHRLILENTKVYPAWMMWMPVLVGAGVLGIASGIGAHQLTKNVPIAVGAGVVGALVGAAIGYLIPV